MWLFTCSSIIYMSVMDNNDNWSHWNFPSSFSNFSISRSSRRYCTSSNMVFILFLAELLSLFKISLWYWASNNIVSALFFAEELLRKSTKEARSSLSMGKSFAVVLLDLPFEHRSLLPVDGVPVPSSWSAFRVVLPSGWPATADVEASTVKIKKPFNVSVNVLYLYFL